MKKKLALIFLLLLIGVSLFWFISQFETFQKPDLFLKQKNAVPYEEWLSDYDEFIREVVVFSDVSGELQSLVQYEKVKQNVAYQSAVQKLSNVFLPEGSNQDLLISAWLNFYNFLVIKFVVDHPHIKSLSDLDSGWKRIWEIKAGEINGFAVSLDFIEHQILRKEFADPRIHFALNCGAISCPNLLNKAYDVRFLEEQLEIQKKQFLFNKQKGMRIDLAERKLYLSFIFKWFAEDFKPKPLVWLRDKGVISEEEATFQLEYLDYDWGLNKSN